MLSNFASETGIHISLKAEPLFKIGFINVTNSMLYGLLSSVLIAVFFVLAAKKITVKARKGSIGIVEMLVEYVLTLLEGPFGTREKAAKYAPVFGAYFFFILFSNLLALLPIVGPGLTISTAEGHSPLFRPLTADLNGTIAMAAIAIITVQVLSIKVQGGKGHLKHYFTDKPLNPINLFIGLLEVMGEFTRMISLSLRLFLNTAVGEILVSVFTSMIAANGRTPLAVLPIILFEMLVAGIQAYVFTVLAATYLSLAISHAHDEHHESDHHTDSANNKVEEHN